MPRETYWVTSRVDLTEGGGVESVMRNSYPGLVQTAGYWKVYMAYADKSYLHQGNSYQSLESIHFPTIQEKPEICIFPHCQCKVRM